MTSLPFGERVVLRLLAIGGSGIIDQDIEPSKLLHRPDRESAARCLVRHVGLDCHRARALGLELAYRLGILLRVVVRLPRSRLRRCASACAMPKPMPWFPP